MLGQFPLVGHVQCPQPAIHGAAHVAVVAIVEKAVLGDRAQRIAGPVERDQVERARAVAHFHQHRIEQARLPERVVAEIQAARQGMAARSDSGPFPAEPEIVHKIGKRGVDAPPAPADHESVGAGRIEGDAAPARTACVGQHVRQPVHGGTEADARAVQLPGQEGGRVVGRGQREQGVELDTAVGVADLVLEGPAAHEPQVDAGANDGHPGVHAIGQVLIMDGAARRAVERADAHVAEVVRGERAGARVQQMGQGTSRRARVGQGHGQVKDGAVVEAAGIQVQFAVAQGARQVDAELSTAVGREAGLAQAVVEPVVAAHAEQPSAADRAGPRAVEAEQPVVADGAAHHAMRHRRALPGDEVDGRSRRVRRVDGRGASAHRLQVVGHQVDAHQLVGVQEILLRFLEDRQAVLQQWNEQEIGDGQTAYVDIVAALAAGRFADEAGQLAEQVDRIERRVAFDLRVGHGGIGVRCIEGAALERGARDDDGVDRPVDLRGGGLGGELGAGLTCL